MYVDIKNSLIGGLKKIYICIYTYTYKDLKCNILLKNYLYTVYIKMYIIYM